MDRLRGLIGHERSLREIAQALHFWTQSLSPAAVGALHVTCSDESENECVDAFQHGFVQYLLRLPLSAALPEGERRQLPLG